MDFIPFNPWDIKDKSPFGCVEEGELLRLCVSLPTHYRCFRMELVIHADGKNATHFLMKKIENGRFAVEIALPQAALYWYYFKYETDYGINHITKQDYHAKNVADNAKWQLTVYKKNFTTPNKFKGGLIYQIFPDRFFRSDNIDLNSANKAVLKDRILREDWGGIPEWRPDANNKILNNDYFGGNIEGIREKLPYIASLGVTCIYLNPIFEAHSNHRYDTADYLNVDPLLGTNDEFSRLCDEAKEFGIDIILDGVFSHTGADSIYFNINRRYGEGGAYNSQESIYYSWYKFRNWPKDYFCWWNIKILPDIDEENDNFIDFITGAYGVAATWLRRGAAGWRIDVADELPDKFIDAFRKAVKHEKPDALLLGEVWEDASNKISHGGRRRYLLGEQFDSIMNYPFRTAIIDFIKTGESKRFLDVICTIAENYPKQILNLLMNHLGTHDTERIITALSDLDLSNNSREAQSKLKLTKEQRQKAKRLLKMAAVIQYTLPGIPSLYYGDEQGMEGGKDPFNRACFPWYNPDEELYKHFAALGQMRKIHSVFAEGSFKPLSAGPACAAYIRENKDEFIITIANKNPHKIDYYLPKGTMDYEILIGGEANEAKNESFVTIAAEESIVVKIKE